MHGLEACDYICLACVLVQASAAGAFEHAIAFTLAGQAEAFEHVQHIVLVTSAIMLACWFPAFASDEGLLFFIGLRMLQAYLWGPTPSPAYRSKLESGFWACQFY